MKKKVEKLRVFFSLNGVRNLLVHPVYYLGYVITISLKCQISPQPALPPSPLYGLLGHLEGGGAQRQLMPLTITIFV